MEDMYNMKDSMQIQSYCPMMSCAMMSMHSSMPSCMNHNMENNMYGIAAMRNTTAVPYFFQAKVRTVSIEDIED